MDAREEIDRATGIKVTSANIASFQERVAKDFITDLKNNIVCRLTSLSTAQGGHEGTTEGINHEQHAHSNVPYLERHSKHFPVDSCRNCLRGMKLFSNEDQNMTRKSHGRNVFIIINEDSH